MRFLWFILAFFVVQPVLSAPYELAPESISNLTTPVGFKCGLVNGKLVCGDKQGGSKKQGGGKKQDNDDDDDDKPKKSKDNKPKQSKDNKPKESKKEFSCKKAKCEPGMFVLEKPNIYGACCQAGEAPLKHKTTPDEPKKCQFPGEVPPDCNCPPGTEFMGNKGCVEPKLQPVPPAAEGKYCSEDLSEAAHKTFKAGCKGTPYCTSPNTQPPFIWECCCTPKK